MTQMVLLLGKMINYLGMNLVNLLGKFISGLHTSQRLEEWLLSLPPKPTMATVHGGPLKNSHAKGGLSGVRHGADFLARPLLLSPLFLPPSFSLFSPSLYVFKN